MRLLVLAFLLSTTGYATVTEGFAGAKGTFGAIDDWNVFGKDDRVELTSDKYPWRTVGYLSTVCTGALVARNLVLTAAHCIIDPATEKLYPNLDFFYPNRIAFTAQTKSFMEWLWWGTTKPDSFRANDWGIARLKENLGDTYGWMGIDTAERDVLTLAGYSGDFKGGGTAGVHVDCRIKKRTAGMLFHDCDTTRGSSGGPMFFMKGDQAYISALNVAEYRDGGEKSLYPFSYEEKYANVAIPSSVFVEKVKELKGE